MRAAIQMFPFVHGLVLLAANYISRLGERGLHSIELRQPRNLWGVAQRVVDGFHPLRARGNRCYAIRGALGPSFVVEYAGPLGTGAVLRGGQHGITVCMMHIPSTASHTRAPRFRRRRAPHHEVIPQARWLQWASTRNGSASRESIVAVPDWARARAELAAHERENRIAGKGVVIALTYVP